MTGVNALGESAPSLPSEAVTASAEPAQMPQYKLLNESGGDGRLSAHIEKVTHGRGVMVDSELDEGNKTARLGLRTRISLPIIR